MRGAPDFENDVRNAVLQRLEHLPADAPDLRLMSPFDLLVIYLNWQHRFVPARDRKVSHSWEFTANPLRWDQKYRPALEHIIEALEHGGDVNPHLSEDVLIGYEGSVKRAKRKRPDLDLLLSDRQVHHLHLSLSPWRNGFLGRTSPLLYAIIGRKEAFLIDILDHKSFSRERIAHIMIDNWPSASFVHHKANIVFAPQITESDRAHLRVAGIQSAPIERNGKYYYIGLGGVSSAGTRVQHSRQANMVVLGLREFSEMLAAQTNFIRDTARSVGIEPPTHPDVRFVIRSDGWFAIREESSRMQFDIPHVPRDAPW